MPHSDSICPRVFFFPFSPSEVKFNSYTKLIITPVSWLGEDEGTFAQQKAATVAQNEKLLTVLNDSGYLDFIGL